MTQPDGPEARVTALEGEMLELNERVARDFRMATTASINAMRDDLTDLRQEITDVKTAVGNGFAEMRGVIDGTTAGQQHLVRLLDAIIAQQEGTDLA